ncbi:MAG: hypothetical protein GC157_01425 [Frankiales bacterium]|nr:hypothetical protein [Frankiales bacterium]
MVATLVALLAGLRWGVLAGLVTGLALGAGVVTTYGMLLRRHLVAVRRQARAGILALSSMLEQAAAVDGHPAESEPRED